VCRAPAAGPGHRNSAAAHTGTVTRLPLALSCRLRAVFAGQLTWLWYCTRSASESLQVDGSHAGQRILWQHRTLCGCWTAGEVCVLNGRVQGIQTLPSSTKAHAGTCVCHICERCSQVVTLSRVMETWQSYCKCCSHTVTDYCVRLQCRSDWSHHASRSTIDLVSNCTLCVLVCCVTALVTCVAWAACSHPSSLSQPHRGIARLLFSEINLQLCCKPDATSTPCTLITWAYPPDTACTASFSN
jgi:hypothetical protein